MHRKKRIVGGYEELCELRRVIHRCSKRFSLNSRDVISVIDNLMRVSRKIKKVNNPGKLNKLFKEYDRDMGIFLKRLNRIAKSGIYPKISSNLRDMKDSTGEVDDQLMNVLKNVEAESRVMLRKKDINSLRKTIDDYFRIEREFTHLSNTKKEYRGVRNLLYNRLNANELGSVNINYLNAIVDRDVACHILNRFIYEVVSNEEDLNEYEYRWNSYINKPAVRIRVPVNDSEKIVMSLKDMSYGVFPADLLNLVYVNDKDVRDMLAYMAKRQGYLRYECTDDTELLYNPALITDVIKEKSNQPPGDIYHFYNQLFRKDLDERNRLIDLRNTLCNILYPKQENFAKQKQEKFA
ncbi:MAG: hypothetical protein U9Q22_04040 [Candidatus Altiarchaeota archaeon]|nr:hypothetical protein [Candidatus Altiarchaeota archaeon]